MDIVKSIEHEQLKNKIPELKVGDTVKVHQKIKEGNRERIQVFEGIIIKKQNGGYEYVSISRRNAYKGKSRQICRRSVQYQQSGVDEVYPADGAGTSVPGDSRRV